MNVRWNILSVICAIGTGQINYVKYFVDRVKLGHIDEHDINEIYCRAVHSRNCEIFDLIVSKMPTNEANLALGTALHCLEETTERDRGDLERIFKRALKEFPRRFNFPMDEDWIALKIDGIPIHQWLVNTNIRMYMLDPLIGLSYRREVNLVQECLKFAKISSVEYAVLSSICAYILIHMCAGPYYRLIRPIFDRIPAYISDLNDQEEIPPVELIRALADEIKAGERMNTCGTLSTFDFHVMALFACIPRMNLELFEELRDYAGLTYDQVTQGLIKANLVDLFEIYLKFAEMNKIEVDLDSALFLTIATYNQQIMMQLLKKRIKRQQEAFVVACQYHNVYAATYMIKNKMIDVNEIRAGVRGEVLKSVDKMVKKIAKQNIPI